MKAEFGYEIRLKSGELVGDDGEVYYYSEDSAMKSAKRYLDVLIHDEFEDKTVDDFEIIIQKVR